MLQILKNSLGSIISKFIAEIKANIYIGDGNLPYHIGGRYFAIEDLIELDQQKIHPAVLFHELIHWSGHVDRIHRPSLYSFHTPDRMIEEALAEYGAHIMCNTFSINPGYDINNHPYIRDLQYHPAQRFQSRELHEYIIKHGTEAAQFLFDLYNKSVL